MSKLKTRLQKNKTNRWFKNGDVFDAEIMDLAGQATIIYEGSIKLLKNLNSYIKHLEIPEAKHPLSKAATSVRNYQAEMKYPSNAFEEAAVEFDRWFALMGATGHAMSSNSLSHLQSFTDLDCKEIDSHMKLLKKMQKSATTRGKKADKNDKSRVSAEAANESFEKTNIECREMLKNFNANGTKLMNSVAVDFANCFDQYCRTGYGAQPMPSPASPAKKPPVKTPPPREKVEVVKPKEEPKEKDEEGDEEEEEDGDGEGDGEEEK